jgi:putative flippase GtrA
LTFKSEGPIVKQALRFIFLQASLALISAVLLGISVDYYKLPHVYCWLVIMTCITIVNYLFSKGWAFKEAAKI